MFVLYFTPTDSRLLSVIDRKLQQLFVGGLIEHYDSEYKEKINPKRFLHLQDPTGPKVLTLEHLRAGFVVWLVSIVFALAVFSFEWMSRIWKYLIFKHILRSFYQQKQFKMIETRTYNETRAKSAETRHLTTTTVLHDVLIDQEQEEESRPRD